MASAEGAEVPARRVQRCRGARCAERAVCRMRGVQYLLEVKGEDGEQVDPVGEVLHKLALARASGKA